MRFFFAIILIVLLASSAMATEPQLLVGGSISTGTDTDSTYVFSVTYKGNVSATDVMVIINDVPYSMKEMDPLDTTPYDGKMYYYDTRLNAGVNTYFFSCTDTNGANNNTAVKMLLVKKVPALQLSHIDVMISVLAFVPFIIYLTYLSRKITKALERIDKRDESRYNKDEPGKIS